MPLPLLHLQIDPKDHLQTAKIVMVPVSKCS
jgi:hypothetical protein